MAGLFDSGVMSDAQTAISLHLLGVTDPQWTNSLLSRIELLSASTGRGVSILKTMEICQRL